MYKIHVCKWREHINCFSSSGKPSDLSYKPFPTSRRVYCTCRRKENRSTLTPTPIRTQQLQETVNAAPETIYYQYNENIKWFLAEEWSCIKTLCTVGQRRGAGKGKNNIKGNKKYCCYGWDITHSNLLPGELVENIFLISRTFDVSSSGPSSLQYFSLTRKYNFIWANTS